MTSGSSPKEKINPDPFNHGTCSLHFSEVDDQTSSAITEIVKNGWGLEPEKVLTYNHFDPVYSNNFKVITSQGDFNLKKSKINDQMRQKIVNRCLAFLSDKAPVPTLQKTVIGELYYHFSQSLYSLSTHIDGIHFSGSREQLRSAASSLAHLHTHLASFQDSCSEDELFIETYPLDRELFLKLKEYSANGDSDFDKFSLELLQLIEAQLSDEPDNDLPKQLVHLDYHPHNLIFNPDNNELVGILDFDLMRISERARDIALGMHKLGRVFGIHTEMKLDCDSTITERCKEFLTSYSQVREMTENEKRAIPDLIIDEVARKGVYILNKHYIEQDFSSDFDLEKQFTQLKEAIEFKKEF